MGWWCNGGTVSPCQRAFNASTVRSGLKLVHWKAEQLRAAWSLSETVERASFLEVDRGGGQRTGEREIG